MKRTMLRKAGALLSSAAIASLMIIPAVPAWAAVDGSTTLPTVNKTLQMNEGSTVTATFEYTIEPIAIAIGDSTTEKTYTDGPTAAISDIIFTDADSTNEGGTGNITFGGESDASKFKHAGTYAWKITETSGTYEGIGEMQYDSQVYTLIATVVNDDSATAAANKLKFGAFYVVKGEATKTTNDKSAKTDLDYTNKYTERTDENEDSDLVISKAVTGDQGDKTKQFEFTVTFTAPSVLPKDKTAADVLNAITMTPSGDAVITDETAAAADATTRTVKFTASDTDSVTFSKVVAGTKYTVVETAADGYTATYSSVSNGEAATTASENVLIGENTNTGTMTNDYKQVSPTGILISNLPYMLLIGIPVIALAAWFVMRRRRAYQD